MIVADGRGYIGWIIIVICVFYLFVLVVKWKLHVLYNVLIVISDGILPDSDTYNDHVDA